MLKNTLAALAAALSAFSAPWAMAQAYPDRPITMIVAAPAGGSTDVGARVVGSIAEKMLGQPIVIVNKVGAGGQVGWTELARARPDGYTIGFIVMPGTNTVILDPERQALIKDDSFVPIINHVLDAGAIWVRADSPYKTFKELIAAAKAQPGTIRASTTGILSDDHLNILITEEAANVKFRIVHLEGNAAQLKETLGGSVDIAFDNVSGVVKPAKAGQARVLAVTDKERSTFLPDVPTTAELGYPTIISSSTRGIVAPKGSPRRSPASSPRCWARPCRTPITASGCRTAVSASSRWSGPSSRRSGTRCTNGRKNMSNGRRSARIDLNCKNLEKGSEDVKRRALLTAAVGAMAFLAIPAAAQDFPSKPINLMVAYPAGGSTDIGARIVAAIAEKAIGQPIVVVNKGGAGGQVGWTDLSRQKPDGYTIGFVNLPGFNTVILDPDRQAIFNTKSFTTIINQVLDPGVVWVKADSPFKTMQDVIDAAKKEPGKVRAATTGILSDDHLAILMVEEAQPGANFRIVHLEGGAAQMKETLGGNVDVSFDNVGSIVKQVKGGQVRALAVMDTKRSKFLPDVPTFVELGMPNVISSSTRGIVGPKGMDPKVVAKLQDVLKKAMEDKDHVAKLEEAGLGIQIMVGAEYQKYYDDLHEKAAKYTEWAKKRPQK